MSGEGGTLVNAETGEVIAEMTPDEARDITNRMRTAAGVLTELYVDAYTRRAWAALGHASWDAYLAAEFGDFHLRLPREERDDVVGSLRAAGLSIRAIAATGIASKATVERTIAASGVLNEDTSTTGTDGKTYDAVSRAKAKPKPEPIDPGKCTDGFGCPATPGPDGLCAWHRGRRKANEATPDPDSDGDGPPTSSESEQPASRSDDAPSSAVDEGKADTGGTGQPAAHTSGVEEGDGTVPPTVLSPPLPEDWRDRLARSAQLLSCPVEALAAELSTDDVIDLTDLAVHIEAVLNAHQEQNT